MSLSLASMCTMLQIGSVVVVVVEKNEPRVFLEWMHIQHRHRVFFLFCICHGLVWTKLHTIMLTQISYTMWFCVNTIKWQWCKLFCITKHLNIFVWNIIILLNMILPFYPFSFDCTYFIFAFINHYMFACRIRQVFLDSWDKLTSSVEVADCINIGV